MYCKYILIYSFVYHVIFPIVQENEQRGITNTASTLQLGSDIREGRNGGREGGREGGMDGWREGGMEGTENSALSTLDEVERHVIWRVQGDLQQLPDQSKRISANVKSIHFTALLTSSHIQHPPVHACIHAIVLPLTLWFSWYILSCMCVYEWRCAMAFSFIGLRTKRGLVWAMSCFGFPQGYWGNCLYCVTYTLSTTKNSLVGVLKHDITDLTS